MENLVTIRSFSIHSDMAVPKTLLESEGIECFVKDEFMSYPSIDALGGIKLQIKESDLESAIEILKKSGYLKDEDLKPSGLYAKIEKWLSKLKTK